MQGQCGSCYSFSATGALEGAHSLAHDKLVSLSEQNVLDCSVPYGNHGCNGGNTHDVYEYVIDNQGIDIESSYPYRGRGSEGGGAAIPLGVRGRGYRGIKGSQWSFTVLVCLPARTVPLQQDVYRSHAGWYSEHPQWQRDGLAGSHCHSRPHLCGCGRNLQCLPGELS